MPIIGTCEQGCNCTFCLNDQIEAAEQSEEKPDPKPIPFGFGPKDEKFAPAAGKSDD